MIFTTFFVYKCIVRDICIKKIYNLYYNKSKIEVMHIIIGDKKIKSFPIFLILFSFLLIIGYAQISDTELEISGTAEILKTIYITNVSYSSDNNANVSNSSINNYYRTILNSTIGLNDDPDSSITYAITITNLGEKTKKYVETTYDENFYNNEDIVFEINGISPGDEIATNESITFNITFKYKDNIVSNDKILNSILNFKFEDDYVDPFPIVFSQEGACTFNGENHNITGSECSDYTDYDYLDTGIALFSEDNYQKDFEIYFEIDEYSSSGQIFQATLVNSKLENESYGYPGFAYRVSGNNFELTSSVAPNVPRASVLKPSASITKVKIVRKDMVLYYSINDEGFIQVQNLSQFNHPFDVTTTFGASIDGNGDPFRYFIGTLSNIYIKLGEMEEIESSFIINLNPNGGTVSQTSVLVSEGNPVGNLPTPVFEGFTFLGWYTEETGGSLVTSSTVPNSSTTYYARWETNAIMDEVYTLNAECTFNGANANITGSGCSEYLNVKYINTGIKLFDEANYMKDFDISFDVINYDPSAQESGQQQVFMNAKYELTSVNWPGFVIRRKGATNDVEIASRYGSSSVTRSISASSLTSIRVARINRKLYYSFNGGDLIFLQDLNNMTQRFDTPLTFGAAIDAETGEPFRYIKATIANISVQVEE